jgi:hypothetical protein
MLFKLHHINRTNATKQMHQICISITKPSKWKDFIFEFQFIDNMFSHYYKCQSI